MLVLRVRSNNIGGENVSAYDHATLCFINIEECVVRILHK